MFLSNRFTEQNAMKNKEKLKQRLISPKLPPSQPSEHLCVLSSAKNDAIGCQLLPFGFCRVSCLLHPSFILEGKRKKEKRQKLRITLAQHFKSHLPNSEAKDFPIHHTHKTCFVWCTYIYYLYSYLSGVSYQCSTSLFC